MPVDPPFSIAPIGSPVLQPADYLQSAIEEWQRIQALPQTTLAEIAQARRYAKAFAKRADNASSEAPVVQREALGNFLSLTTTWDLDVLREKEKKLWQKELNEAPDAVKKALGLSPSLQSEKEAFAVHFGNHRAAAILVLLNQGKISPDAIVGKIRGGGPTPPLTAGELSQLYQDASLHTLNADQRGNPWIDTRKVNGIINDFDLQKFFDPGRDDGIGITLHRISAERASRLPLYREITCSSTDEPFPHYLMKNSPQLAAASRVAEAVSEPQILNAAGAPIGVVMGVSGLVSELSNSHSDFHKDLNAGGAREAAAVAGLSGNVANTAGGLVQTTHGITVAVKGMSILEGLADIAGKAAIPLVIGAGITQMAAASEAKDGHRFAKAVGGTTGGIAGGVIGSIMAATAMGFVGGSVVPGPGNVIGAGVGLVCGIGGAVVGMWAGSKGADALGGDSWDKAFNKPAPNWGDHTRAAQLAAAHRATEAHAHLLANVPAQTPHTPTEISAPLVASLNQNSKQIVR